MKVNELITIISAHLSLKEEVDVVIGAEEMDGGTSVSIRAGDRAVKIASGYCRITDLCGTKIYELETKPINELEILTDVGDLLLGPAVEEEGKMITRKRVVSIEEGTIPKRSAR